MEYKGNVAAGGASDQRDLPLLTIRKASVGEMSNNVYLLTCVHTGAQLLIDAADDPARVLSLVAEGSGWLDAIVTTHQHWDHHRALIQVVEATNATTAAGDADADALPVIPDRRLRHGDALTFGEVTLKVIHLRGHTPGSVALAYNDPTGHTHIWTGDSLFPGGVGNTQNDPDRFASLLDDVQTRIFVVYDDDTWIYPGHGRDTTLGAERPHLQEWRERGW
ncbi:MAG: MBL fold metallo-hydrolase [Phycicoccus sp.]|nr:MBL fold metallo-hydrolase [Phycicoccus sp.]NMM35661.1 MBL fold metallo-hydrolase [Phycicoccus sp.]